MAGEQFVTVYNPELPGSVASVPESLLDHHAQRGFVPVPDGVNLADVDAVAALFEPPKPAPKSKKSTTTEEA